MNPHAAQPTSLTALAKSLWRNRQERIAGVGLGSISMSGKWRHKPAGLEDEKQREAHFHHWLGIAAYFCAG